MKKNWENVKRVTGAEGSEGKGDREKNKDKCLTPESEDGLGPSPELC